MKRIVCTVTPNDFTAVQKTFNNIYCHVRPKLVPNAVPDANQFWVRVPVLGWVRVSMRSTTQYRAGSSSLPGGWGHVI